MHNLEKLRCGYLFGRILSQLAGAIYIYIYMKGGDEIRKLRVLINKAWRGWQLEISEWKKEF